MNYLQLVQQAILRSSARYPAPSTLVGATDQTLDFATWVQDSWRELQEESLDWAFRQKLDQTLTLTTGVDEYAMPANLETLNFRTLSTYTVAKEDEGQIDWLPYEKWRIMRDTKATANARPIEITQRPDGKLQVFPAPDKTYYLRYDGVYDIDAMSLDTDTPGFNIAGTTTLQSRHQWILVWDAVRRFAESREDGAGVASAQARYLVLHAKLVDKRTPPIYVKPGVLTGARRGFWGDYSGGR